MGEVRGREVVVLLSYFCLLAEEELVEGVYSGASCDEHEAPEYTPSTNSSSARRQK